MPRWLDHWLARHRNPTSFWLHMVGIPMTIAAIPLAIVQLKHNRWDLWWRPVGLIVVGYLLQWIGHRIEGNHMGELILIKKWRGKPYVAISPRYRRPGDPADRSASHDMAAPAGVVNASPSSRDGSPALQADSSIKSQR